MHTWVAEPPRDWLPATALDLEVDEEQKSAGDTATIRALGGRVNRVQLGVPQTIDLLSSWPSTDRLKAEVAAAAGKFEFYSVRIACSFLPDRGCQFVHAQLDITLSDPAGEPAGAEPVVIDLFPRDITVKSAFSRTYGLKAGVKFAFAEVSVDGSRKDDTIRYEPALTGGGLLTGSPSWSFDRTTSTGLSGSSELFLLIKKAKGQQLDAQFALGAQVRTAWGLLRYARPKLLDIPYTLSLKT